MKVLIIDDEPLVRRSLSRAMQKKSWLVSEAHDGAEGLKLWREQKPDLILLDVLMPGLSGPQVLQSIEPEIRERCKVILMSAYAGEHSGETTKNLGADLFMAKPFEDIFKVLDICESLLGKK